MRFVKVLSLIALVGFFTVIARADTAPADPIIALHYPDPCSVTDVYCANLDYTGLGNECVGFGAQIYAFFNGIPCATDTGGPLVFPTVPASGLADPGLSLYTCEPASTSSPPFWGAFAESGDVNYPFSFDTVAFSGKFFGCAFDGILFPGETFSVGSSGPITLDLPPGGPVGCTSGCGPDGQIDLFPEPSTWVLFVTGLLLLCVAGFARKRFGSVRLTAVPQLRS
jgi:hypothetical protein